LIRGEVTAGQPLDLEAELAQSFLREVNLPVFKGIFVAAANQERELTAVSLKEFAEVEPTALRFLISHEACCCGEIEQAVVAVQGVIKLADPRLHPFISFLTHTHTHQFYYGKGQHP